MFKNTYSKIRFAGFQMIPAHALAKKNRQPLLLHLQPILSCLATIWVDATETDPSDGSDAAG